MGEAPEDLSSTAADGGDNKSSTSGAGGDGPGVTTMTTTTLLDDPDLQYSIPVVSTGGVLRPTPQEHFVVGEGGGPRRRRQQRRATRIRGRRSASSAMLGTTSSSQQGEDGNGGGHRLRSVLLDTPWPFSAAGERWWWWRRGRRHGLHGRQQRKLDYRRPVRAGLPQESRRRAVRHLPPASIVQGGRSQGCLLLLAQIAARSTARCACRGGMRLQTARDPPQWRGRWLFFPRIGGGGVVSEHTRTWCKFQEN
ncbi:unnamed protein product [Ectocarpus sp. 8 AP-2014]